MNKPENYPQEPSHLWNRFYELTRVPRPSKKESKIRGYLVQTAKDNNLEFKVDQIGNVVIYLPATEGYESHEPVIIQNHMDMVCDSTPDRKIDFENDPIEIFVEDGWIKADGTTLGADNGFGCAAALALIDDKNIKHPPLELLFTVDEETGLNGALQLDASMISGRKLINLDTEDWGCVYIGCAGGVDYEFFGECELKKVKPEMDVITCSLEVRGLKGGHSGIDIHRGRGNALKILAEVLWDIRRHDFDLVSFEGGKAHNIIPRDAFCKIRIRKKDISRIREVCRNKMDNLKKFLREEDHGLEIGMIEIEEIPGHVLTKKERDRVLALLNLFPHGAYDYNWDLEEPIVNYSSNFAIMTIDEGKLYIQTSIRYVDPLEVEGLKQKFETISKMFKIKMEDGGGYPSWKPVLKNNLLDLVKSEYERLFNSKAKSKAIHAGLECGILKGRLGEMDMISIGPNITGAHSPTESLEIDSSCSFWALLASLLEKL